MISEKLFIEAFECLKTEMKKHSSIQAKFRGYCLKVIETHKKEIEVTNNKFVLSVVFFQWFVKDLKLDSSTTKDTSKMTKEENYYYKHFNRLKKFNLIHKKSASNFPKSLSLLSINPNHQSLLVDNFSDIDNFSRKTKLLKSIILENNSENIIANLYVYLRLFMIFSFSKKVLQNIYMEDILILSNNKVVLIVYENILFNTVKDRLEHPYKTYVLDQIASSALIKIKHSLITTEVIFNDCNSLEKRLSLFINENLKGRKKASIKLIRHNYYLFYSTPLLVTVGSRTITFPGLTLAEINTIYPNSVPEYLMEYEKRKILAAQSRPDKNNYDEQDTNVGFSIYDLEDLLALLRNRNNSPSQDSVRSAIKEVSAFYRLSQTNHEKMIYQYLLYLLKLHKNKKLRLSTIKGYIWVLNKHIFKMVENLEDIKHFEIIKITDRLEIQSYKESSIKSVKSQLARFFRYFRKKGFSIDITTASYPKSLIFNFEIDEILSNIEQQYLQSNNITRLSKAHKYNINQRKLIVLLSFYTGLREKEVYSLRLSDIYIYDNNLFVDVNYRGLRKVGHKLKTNSSKRRVHAAIKNEKHLIFMKSTLAARESLKNRAAFLFLKLSNRASFLNEVIEETIFNELNIIIKNVTKRYCTFHSLRHSYISYSFESLISKDKKYPYSFLELSTMAGHQTPYITINTYTHYSLLSIMNN